MRKLLNTLFVTSENAYLSLDGENVVASRDGQEAARYPLHMLSGILSFSYAGASPALMGACAKRGVSLAFCTPGGRFLARVGGEGGGNVLLRRSQYRAADDPAESCRLARCMIAGKLYNARWSIERTRRDHALRVDEAALSAASDTLQSLLPSVAAEIELERLRGLEGEGRGGLLRRMGRNDSQRQGLLLLPRTQPAAAAGPGQRASVLRVQPARARLRGGAGKRGAGRLRRLPAPRPAGPHLAGAGSDGGIAAVHGRPLRAYAGQQPRSPHPKTLRRAKAAPFCSATRRGGLFLKHWQEKKQDTLTHPYLKEKLPWGLVPYVQALLLARCLRGDLDAYPPFLWK